MTLYDAQKAILCGIEYGDVYPHVTQEEKCELAEWYVSNPNVPALHIRASGNQQVGDPCMTCGGNRLVQAGACKVCLDCGTSGGCG